MPHFTMIPLSFCSIGWLFSIDDRWATQSSPRLGVFMIKWRHGDLHSATVGMPPRCPLSDGLAGSGWPYPPDPPLPPPSMIGQHPSPLGRNDRLDGHVMAADFEPIGLVLTCTFWGLSWYTGPICTITPPFQHGIST